MTKDRPSGSPAKIDPVLKPELLAPAGGPASWAAAVEAGADAVYCGLDRFSARSVAENFSLAELSGLIKESRKQGVKVYLALNSLIKEAELPEAYKLMMAAAEMEPDAFIIQDPGLAALCRRHAHRVALHASTLTAVHTLDGLKALKYLGFARAVLPREMSLKDIAELCQRSPLGLEIFIHGAMCFSFSGLCLMSSFLGGRSAARGSCTQPCRRSYQNAGRPRTFFSLSDFSAATLMAQIRKTPLAALKIEGRMKGPDSVGRVVSAYRLLLDAPDGRFEEAVEEARSLLAKAPGRSLAEGGYLAGEAFSQALFDRQAVSGIPVGAITPDGPGQGAVELISPVSVGDRLRLVASVGLTGEPFKLKKLLKDGEAVDSAEAGETVTVVVSESDEANAPRGELYLTGSSALEKKFLGGQSVKNLKSAAARYKPSNIALPPDLAGTLSRQALPGRSQPLWFWLDGPKDLDEILKFRPAKIVMPLTAENVKELSKQRKRFGSLSDFVWSLPPLLFGRSQEKIRREAAKLVELGARDFLISNLGQAALLDRLKAGLKIWGDHRLGILNHLAAQSLSSMGLSGVTISLEADQETVEKLSQADLGGGVLMYLYGRPALFTSRSRPPSLKRGPVVSQRGEKFWTAEDGEAFILQSEHRVFIGGLLRAPKPKGFVGLLVDFRREPNLLEAARRVKKAIDQGRGSPGLSFNFKRGLQ
jgi:putative protease